MPIRILDIKGMIIKSSLLGNFWAMERTKAKDGRGVEAKRIRAFFWLIFFCLYKESINLTLEGQPKKGDRIMIEETKGVGLLNIILHNG